MSHSFDTTYWRTEKIVTLDEMCRLSDSLRSDGKVLVTVNGCFDILHVGHLDQLEEAKRQGDALFVAINSDASIRDGKGPERPFVAERARAALLAALECVDYVAIIDAPYVGVPDVLLAAVRPHVHVNGPDYGSPTEWREWPLMEKYHIRGHVVERRNDFSTTALVARIRGLTT